MVRVSTRKLRQKILKPLLFAGLTSTMCGGAGPTSGEGDRKPSLREIRQERLGNTIEGLDLAVGSDLAAVALSDLRVRVWRLNSGEMVHEFTFPQPETDARQN